MEIDSSPLHRKPHVNVGTFGRRSPMLGAAMLGMLLGSAAFLDPNPRYFVGASSALPDDPQRAKKAEEKRKRRAAKPGASDYAKRNA